LPWRCEPTRVMASSFLRFLDHTQRRTTVARTPLDEWSARRRDLYLTTHFTHNRQTPMPPVGLEPLSQQASGRWPMPDAIYRLINYSNLAVHVSGDVFAHHTEHFTVFTVSGSVVFTQVAACWCLLRRHQQAAAWVNTTLPDTVNTVKCSVWWAKPSPETCRANFE
jgi:hypothetical protein